jgi:hypothetical protein
MGSAPVWSPDGKYIIFNGRRSDDPASLDWWVAPVSGGPAVRHIALSASPLPGPGRLRLVAAPADVELGAGDVDRLAPRLTLVDLPFEVERP